MVSIFGGHCISWNLLIWSLYLSSSSFCIGLLEVYEKECQGTATGFTFSGVDDIKRYFDYGMMYENCTVVLGNLEIIFMQLTDAQFDFSFLETILEVNGYVLIAGNYVDRIRLSRLRVIRGLKTLPATENEIARNFSLYVAWNAKPGHDSIGLKELSFASLVEIQRGDILFKENQQLCFGETTVNWKYIVHNNPKATIITNPWTLCGFQKRSCYKTCHENCTTAGGRFCWDEGLDMCQAERPCKNCRRGCSGNGCFCNPECIGGCTGPDASSCVGCKNALRGDRCVHQCAASEYNQSTKQWDISSTTLTHGTKCVEKCPENMLIQIDRCVSKCEVGYIEKRTSNETQCVPCHEKCPKTCYVSEPWLHGNNLAQFNQCTKVEGNLKINSNSFMDNALGPSIQLTDLEILKDIEEITGMLMIDAWHPNLTSLSFLRNLRVIGGIGGGPYSLIITKTPLTTMDLNSLRQIKKGGVYILKNAALCYAYSINWTGILTSKDNTQRINIKLNANSPTCEEQDLVCSGLCSSLGCWGPENDNCVSCRNYSMEGRCVSSCLRQEGFHWFETEDGILACEKICHEECLLGCTGSGPDRCVSCRHVINYNECLSECPENRYSDLTGTCQWCDGTCKGCSGNSSRLGLFGCNNCQQGLLLIKNESEKYCLQNENECGEIQYWSHEYVNTIYGMVPMITCRNCHPECDGCRNGNKSTDCIHCRNYSQIDRLMPNYVNCVSNCSYNDGYYDAGNKVCQPCDLECKRCYGPKKHQCSQCFNVRIYSRPQDVMADDEFGKSTSHEFYCAKECPSNQEKKLRNVNDTEWSCTVSVTNYSMPEQNVAIPVSVFLFLTIVIAIFVVFWRKQKLRRLQERLLANDEIPMMSSSKAKPDMSLLRLIKESELRRGNMIGKGAFGTVYKGIWIPEKENIKIPVAIKVLKESSNTSQNVELLDEARIMASVCNPYCVRILAVCLTAQMMLITQLMPLGCLLDYVRKEKSNIGSRALLLWSVQIAKGMNYLQELGIIHRDLAARNVLVHSPNQVKITDFGLAKLLDYEEEEIQSEGGKMPVKWLALECIKYRVYTHKSDIWSYGVTLWEMFTYGDRPYENLAPQQIPQALEKGERLPQPCICTIDVYMIMIKCWMLDVDCRPSFADLINEFTKMAQDPGRFLAIPGDKLMRLPTTVPDAKDLVSQMCLLVDEPDLLVVSGDDYFQPMDLDLGGNESSAPGIPSRPGPFAMDQTIRMDEDGYLSPQSATTEPSYLDVVYCPENGSTDSQNKQNPLDDQQQQYLDMRPSTELTKNDPEYNAKQLTTSGSAGSNKLAAPGASEGYSETRSEYYNDP